MTEQLTAAQIAEFKEAFTFFDKDSDGFVNIEELPLSNYSFYFLLENIYFEKKSFMFLVVRAINMNPTQRELMEWMADVIYFFYFIFFKKKFHNSNLKIMN